MYVIKSDGRKEEFDEKKVYRSCIRSGASKKQAQEVVNFIRKDLYDGVTTKEIYSKVREKLKEINPKHSMKYSLREALSELGPEAFEVYISNLLEENGYKCEWNVLIKGASVEHQIDIVATKDGKAYLVECKRHERFQRFSGLKTILQIHARLQDIKKGYNEKTCDYNFNSAWIITNTKFSQHAIDYAKANKIKLTGWKYPKNQGIEKLVNDSKSYPITVLHVKDEYKTKLNNNKIVSVGMFMHSNEEEIKRKCSLNNKDMSIIKDAIQKFIDGNHE